MKTAIITGGNRGIGLGITSSFLKSGYKVVVGARSDTGIQDQFDSNIKFVFMDVKDEMGHQKLIKTAMDWTGNVHVYINNAGFSEWRPIQNIDEAFFNEMINVNLKGTFWGCKVAANYLEPNGTIINISSIAGKRGTVNNSMYCASKFGVNGLTQALSKELGPKQIRVNAVCPVLISTKGLIDALDSPFSPAKDNIKNFLETFAENQSALGRLPNKEEVGSVCVFLASDEASAITGQCINIDCGVLPQ
tara:strand:+ start:18495 stop:19238 length:744 start_codon:yes stop_codon:yes gene_type:complete